MTRPNKIVRISADVARQLRLTASLARVPVETACATALRYFSRLPPELQSRLVWSFLQTSCSRQPAKRGIRSILRAAYATLGGIVHWPR